MVFEPFATQLFQRLAGKQDKVEAGSKNNDVDTEVMNLEGRRWVVSFYFDQVDVL
jgi:hypothetical protein